MTRIHHISIWSVAVFSLLLVTGCEEGGILEEDPLDEIDNSDLTPEPDARFSTAKDLSDSLLRQIDLAANLQRSNSISYPFCIYTIKTAQNAQAEADVLSWATIAMNTWIAPLVGQPGWRVNKATAYRVQKTNSGCPSTDRGLRVYSIEISDMKGANNVYPGFQMHMGGWGVHKLVVLHEMGHGIGLGDGYSYGNGTLTPVGQPPSNMQNGWGFNGVLQKDDIEGIRFLWARIRGDRNSCPPGYVTGGCTGSRCSWSYYCVPGGNNNNTGTCGQASEGSNLSLSCPSGQVIGGITFASYGTPTGSCPKFATGSCHASTSKSKVESLCLNKQSCSVSASNSVFGDPCSGTRKGLAVVFSCRSGSSTGLAAKDLAGYYERSPVQNDWHKVNVTFENNSLKWKNQAGVTWSLQLSNDVLRTGSDCPYGAQTITVEKQGANTVTGIRFRGELYKRR